MFVNVCVCVCVHAVCLVYEIKSIWESNIPIYKLQWSKRKTHTHTHTMSKWRKTETATFQTLQTNKPNVKKKQKKKKNWTMRSKVAQRTCVCVWAKSLSKLHAHASILRFISCTHTHTHTCIYRYIFNSRIAFHFKIYDQTPISSISSPYQPYERMAERCACPCVCVCRLLSPSLLFIKRLWFYNTNKFALFVYRCAFRKRSIPFFFFTQSIQGSFGFQMSFQYICRWILIITSLKVFCTCNELISP